MENKRDLVKELTREIGYSETIELLRGWGGRRLYIPQNIDELHPIALCVGLTAAEQLSLTYGGTTLEIPKGRNALIEVRNNCIVRDLDNGTPTRVCAQNYGLSARHVRLIRDKHCSKSEGRRWDD